MMDHPLRPSAAPSRGRHWRTGGAGSAVAAWLLASAIVALLAACGEKPQSAGHKPDAEPWQGAQTVYTAPGWKPADRASWEQQIRSRNQGQNEYARTPVTQ